MKKSIITNRAIMYSRRATERAAVYQQLNSNEAKRRSNYLDTLNRKKCEDPI